MNNQISEEKFSSIIKNLEPRWGLTLASFLPQNAREDISKLQTAILNRWDKCSEYDNIQTGFSFYIYDTSNLHCTHFTLKRSNPCSPIKRIDFVKSGTDLFELFKFINEIASEVQPFDGVLDKLEVKQNGIELILFGQCFSNKDIEYRSLLLKGLNDTLPDRFNLDIRKFDSDPTQFHKLHCCIGYVKRPHSIDFDNFKNEIEALKFDPIKFRLDKIQLIHHKYRSLAFPQHGIFTFPLGEKIKTTKEEFIMKLNLA